jgi:lipid II:glycine glycyltransferase (peptidoglycan interpeptide bridge formation enzyme)
LGEFDGQRITAGYQLTIHPLPFNNFHLAYLPKSLVPSPEIFASLKEIGRQYNCIFVKIEPNALPEEKAIKLLNDNCFLGRPLFTKYTFQIDLNLSEEQLLTNMKEKTRYNLRLAQKHGVVIHEDNSPQAFAAYLRLTQETTKRQRFFAHSPRYHQLMWETLQPPGLAHLLTATYQGKILVTWILFLFNNILYYPYGASSDENRETMASNLMMWEAIRWGKANNAKIFDLWGALGPNPNRRDPWYGFHRFKEGYGGKLVEFVGTYDFVIDNRFYSFYNTLDKARWKFLRFKSWLLS